MSVQIKEPVPARAAAYVALYPMLLQIAKDHGYSLCVHGSVHRDLDLVAVPWVDSAKPALELVRAIKRKLRAVVHHELRDHLFKDCNPTQKPHGRVAYSLHFTNQGMYGGYLDLSVMPRRSKAAAKSCK
jgi:hypothetical protein